MAEVPLEYHTSKERLYLKKALKSAQTRWAQPASSGETSQSSTPAELLLFRLAAKRVPLQSALPM